MRGREFGAVCSLSTGVKIFGSVEEVNIRIKIRKGGRCTSRWGAH